MQCEYCKTNHSATNCPNCGAPNTCKKGEMRGETGILLIDPAKINLELYNRHKSFILLRDKVMVEDAVKFL